jgi:hypothetical protein
VGVTSSRIWRMRRIALTSASKRSPAMDRDWRRISSTPAPMENLPWMEPCHGSVYCATYIGNLRCNAVIFTYATCFVLGFLVISNMCAILLNE